MLISVIIPVYKVEQYLRQCVESVLHQTYKSIEVILVDDGSPDKSPEICDDYVRQDNRVRVIHKRNGGLSDTRNAGLKIATGDYVMFLDSDDFWRDNYSLERLVNEIEKTPECDFIGFNCSYYYAGEKEVYTPWVAYNESVIPELKKEELIKKITQTGTIPVSACLKIIKRDFLLNNNISFKVGILSEDIPWFLEILRKTSCFRLVNDYIYAYRQSSVGSITHSFSKRNFDDLFNIIKSEIPLTQEANYNAKTKEAVLSILAYEWCILLASLYKISDKDERSIRRQALKKYAFLLQYQINPKVAKVNRLYKIVGLKLTELVLNRYLASKK